MWWSTRGLHPTCLPYTACSRGCPSCVLRTLDRRRHRVGEGAPQFDAEFALEGRMGNDVIIGDDATPRCAWVGAADTALGRYHDEVWGARTYDETAMFEALTLGVFEVGLNWSIVFGKRDAFRTAFRGFDVARVAAMTERDVDQLPEDT